MTRTTWKLAGLALLALVVIFFLIVPLATVQVTVNMPPGTTEATPQAVNRAATWTVMGLGLAFALTALGAIGWVVRHILRKQRRPES